MSGSAIPQIDKAPDKGLQIERRLTRNAHLEKKRKQHESRRKQFTLLGRSSRLHLNYIINSVQDSLASSLFIRIPNFWVS